MLALYGITDTRVQKITKLCSNILLMRMCYYKNVYKLLNSHMIYERSHSKKGQNFFGKLPENICSTKVKQNENLITCNLSLVLSNCTNAKLIG